MYDKLVEKGNDVDTRGFAWKNKCDTDKSESGKAVLMQIKNLNRSENKIPDVNNVVRKINYNDKIRDIGNK